MGAMEELEWGEGRGVMHINCSLPEENLLVCDAEERVQKWKLSRTPQCKHLMGTFSLTSLIF